MDGQDPNRRGYEDPAWSNHQARFNTPQNTRGNSFSGSSGNRLPKQRSDPTPPVSRPDPSSSYQLPFGSHSYYGGTSSTVSNNNVLNQSQYDNPYGASPSQQPSSQGYYASVPYTTSAPYTTATLYQSAAQPILPHNLSFSSQQQYSQRQFGQPAQLPQGYHNDHNHHSLYDLEDNTPLPDPPQLQLQQHLLPISLPYHPSRQLPAYAAAPLPPLPPPPPPNPPAAFGGQAIMNRTLFEQGLERVYTALPPITTIINNHGDLNQARTMLMRITEDLLASVEELQLTIDVPDQDTRGTQMWADLNHAWLALFQAQYNRVYDLQQAGASANNPHLMTHDTIYTTITRLADLAQNYVEDRGLLDYGLGLWESNITQAADRCLELLSTVEDGDE